MTQPSECYPSNNDTSPAPSGAVDLSNANGYLACKIAVEFVLSILLFVSTLPLILVAMVLVRLTSPGPAIYRQTRVGRSGRLFTMYKIRSMVVDSERSTGAQWATPRDPRVTLVGRFLRVTHLDELPQLWNVLRGDMSLVGPRPERPEFVGQFERAIPCYRDRLSIRPGVTGLAQVQLPPDTDLNSVRRKLACDLYYVQRVSLWLDVRILLCTVMGVLGVPFTISKRLLRIPSGSAVEKAYRDLSAKRIPVLQMQSA